MRPHPVLIAALLLGLAAPAAASTISIGPSCGTCQGSIYTLDDGGAPTSTAGPTEIWQITYTIDTSGYNGGGTRLDSAALKVSAALVSANLVSAPGGVANWVETLGGIDASGCSGSGSGFDCVQINAVGNAPTVPDGILTFVFDLEIVDGGIFTDLIGSTVKARYVDEQGDKVGDLVSEEMPEPVVAWLLAAGLAGLLAAGRKRG
jgi:hypothetical protein